MTGAKKPIDHGFRELKWLLRQRLLAGITPAVAVDLYAGEGRILTELYRGFRQVHAVEKDPDKYDRLQRRIALRLQGPGRPLVATYRQDNRVFIRERLAKIADVNLLDFDAYGNPHPLIAAVFQVWTPHTRTAIAVTDAGRIPLLRAGRVNLAHYRPGTAAEAKGRPARVRPLSAEEYELLVQGFWRELAERHRFALLDFFGAWAPGRRVLYYGVWIEPDRNLVDRDRPPCPQPLEPQPHGPGEPGQAPPRD